MACQPPRGEAVPFTMLHAPAQPCGEDLVAKAVLAANRPHGTVDGLTDAVKTFFELLTSSEALTLAV